MPRPIWQSEFTRERGVIQLEAAFQRAIGHTAFALYQRADLLQHLDGAEHTQQIGVGDRAS